jgi:hypothetical protein
VPHKERGERERERERDRQTDRHREKGGASYEKTLIET